MLLVYRKSDGSVLVNTGTHSRWPAGPPDELVPGLLDAHGLDPADVALLRLHDDDDAELVAQLLDRQAVVVDDQVEVGDPWPDPEPDPDPVDELRDAIANATTVAQLRDALLGANSSAHVAAVRRPDHAGGPNQ